MRFPNSQSIFLLVTLSLLGNTLTPRSQVSVAGHWQCTETGLEAETISFRLELTQSGATVGGVWIIGNDEIPIREGKVQDNRIELITFADDKQFTTVTGLKGMSSREPGKTIQVVLERGRVNDSRLDRSRLKSRLLPQAADQLP
jgi:hypothetical protein